MKGTNMWGRACITAMAVALLHQPGLTAPTPGPPGPTSSAGGEKEAEAVPAAREFRPEPEPPFWQTTRRRLQQDGIWPDPLPGWIYIRGVERQEMKAAEYLRKPTARSGSGGEAVEFEAAVLVRRAGTPWRLTTTRMRALCDTDTLEQAQGENDWVVYRGDGRQETLQERVRWICTLTGPTDP